MYRATVATLQRPIDEQPQLTNTNIEKSATRSRRRNCWTNLPCCAALRTSSTPLLNPYQLCLPHARVLALLRRAVEEVACVVRRCGACKWLGGRGPQRHSAASAQSVCARVRLTCDECRLLLREVLSEPGFDVEARSVLGAVDGQRVQLLRLLVRQQHVAVRTTAAWRRRACSNEGQRSAATSHKSAHDGRTECVRAREEWRVQ